MIWVAITALALAGFAFGALLLRAERGTWTLFAAALVFGLAGYAWQGSPGLASAPLSANQSAPEPSPRLIETRREFFDPSRPPSRFVVTGDSFARRADYATATGFYRNAVAENPNDGEGWLALAVALGEHSRGQATPAVVYAYQRARDALPGNPGPGFFAALSEMRTGNLPAARNLWAEALAAADDDAVGRDFLAGRLATLDRLLAAVAAQGGS